MSTVSSLVRSAGRLSRLSPLSSTLTQASFRFTARTVVQASTRQQPQLVMAARTMATKGDGEISKFLKEEIATEKQNQKKLINIGGWEIKTEGAEVTMTKNTSGGEKVVVSANVNHSVDSAEPDDGTGEAPEMLSRPNFEVDIVKGNGRTLSFSCSFLSADDAPEGQEQEFDDVFAIDEITMFDGEDWNEKRYAVAGDIVDGYLYDMFMNMLEERGVDSEFVDQFSEFCSAHEHGQYINLLDGIDKFVKM